MAGQNAWRALGIGLLGALCLHGGARAQDTVVVTSLQATYSLASALAEGTGVRVDNAPAQGSRMAGQERFLAQAALDPLFVEADAVVTVTRVWQEDPLFPAARRRNIRVIEIDAAWPLDAESAPVSLVRRSCAPPPWETADGSRCANDLSPYVWLSISNGVRMTENIAADLVRLAPMDAERVESNLARLTGELRSLKADFDNRFAAFGDARVFALAEEFDYLLGEMGVFVDGAFTKEDVLWSENDLQAFESYLRDSGIAVVVHKWEPSESIRGAIARAGAKLVILDTGDPGIVMDDRLDAGGYTLVLRNNLEALASAFSGR